MSAGKRSRPALKVTWRPLTELKPFETNPRIHPPSAIEKLAASIASFGFRVPILLDATDTIIAGHTRLLAARRLDLARVPVIVCGDLSPEQVRALRLADNRTAQESSWEPELLAGEIAAVLLDCGYELEVCGFDPEELQGDLAAVGPLEGEAEVLPEVPTEPVTRPGDLWLLGPHRLLCGDATDAADVSRPMDGSRATLMATDPPYLVDYCGGIHPQTWANGGKAGKPRPPTKHWDPLQGTPSSRSRFFRRLPGRSPWSWRSPSGPRSISGLP